jgi:outer membrane protein
MNLTKDRRSQLFALLMLAAAATSRADQGTEPLLTLDEAVSLALQDNRVVKIAALEEQKAGEAVSVARSRRLPQFHVDVLAGSNLHPFDFTFPAGSFGNYPETGPIPAADAKIETPARATSVATAAIDQPLTQLHKIGLGVRMSELGREMARESVRAERHKLVAEVRSAYFGLVAAQEALDAARESVRTLTEMQRVTADYEAQQAVLRADALQVEAGLARSRYEVTVAENRVASAREALNDLLGRRLDTRFRVEPIPAQAVGDLTLEAARQRAAQNRPEARQAELRHQQAEQDRRLAKAEYIPDVSLSLRYVGFYNFEVLPRHVTSAGLFLSWEPFDWRRRHHKVTEKTRGVEQAREGTQQAQSRIALEVGVKHRLWSEAALLLEATRATHEAAREQLRVTSDKYREEAALLKDLLEAQARSAEAEARHQGALSSYWSALADLRRAMGDE